MARVKNRIDKKRHRHWLDLEIIDLSWHVPFRRMLMAAPHCDSLPIDSAHLEGLPTRVAAVVKKWNLRYLAAKVDVAEVPPDEAWIAQNGAIVFKFWATDYPSVRRFTGNTPDPV